MSGLGRLRDSVPPFTPDRRVHHQELPTENVRSPMPSSRKASTEVIPFRGELPPTSEYRHAGISFGGAAQRAPRCVRGEITAAWLQGLIQLIKVSQSGDSD